MSAEMEKYPVRPGVVVHLPRRREEPAAKKSYGRRKAALPPEEQVKRLKKVIRRLNVALLVLVLLLFIAGYFTVVHLMENDMEFLPGQNYNSVTDVLSDE